MFAKPSFAVLHRAALGWLALVAGASAAELNDRELGFSMTVPKGFEKQKTDPSDGIIVHTFVRDHPDEAKADSVVAIQKLNGVIGPEKLTQKDLPKDFAGKLYYLPWQGHELSGFVFTQEAGGKKVVTYAIQVPLRRQAVQLMVAGPADEASEHERLIKQCLATLRGESNLELPTGTSRNRDSILSSPANTSARDKSELRTAVFIAIVGSTMIAVLAALWVISRYAPRGGVLILSIAIFLLAKQIPDSSRMALLLGGTLQLSSVAGVLLGIWDLLRRRNRSTQEKRAALPRTG